MDISAGELLEATVAAIDRLKSAIRPAQLAYLLLSGSCENTIRDLLACELIGRGMLVARDWEIRVGGKRLKVDIAVLNPHNPEGLPLRLIELKWQNCTDCRKRGDGYPYLVNVQRDFDSRAALGVPAHGLVLFRHALGAPELKFQKIVRFCRQIQKARGGMGDSRLLRFRDQLHEDFGGRCIVVPGLADPLCRIPAGTACETPVELACWVVELRR